MSGAPDDTGRGLARGIAAIVLAGLALGIGFNAMQRAAGPRHGLDWIRHEVKLASLEALASPATAADSTTAARDTAAASAPAPDTAHAAAPAHAARDTAHARRGSAPKRGPAAPPSPATPKPATTKPAAPAADVPAVPDTREPLEAQYATIKKLWDAGAALFVDARTPEEYAEAHIPGAVSLPFDLVFKDPDLAKRVDTKGRAIVVTYCGGGDCDLSRNLAFSLIEAGQHKVLVFMGGMPGWKDAGNAVATGKAPGAAPGDAR